VKFTQAQLKAQLDDVTRAGWLPFFQAAAIQTGIPVELLLAIGSRETNLKNIKGDFRKGEYHGFGIMQVDIGTDRAFCEAWTEAKVAESIIKGATILRAKFAYLRHRGIPGSWKNTAAAYNAGEQAVITAIQTGEDPDSKTTGKDYGSDVAARAEIFARLRTQPPRGPVVAPLKPAA
jgi:hypothetical protein